MELTVTQSLSESENNSVELKKAYDFCQAITRQHAKSFYFSARFLKPEKRRPIYALYALCRLVDDEVDATAIGDEPAAIIAVKRWQAKLNEVYLQVPSLSAENESQTANGELRTTNYELPVLLAWRDLLSRYKIRQELPLELMRGVLMDTHIKRYETWDELYVYCYRVASTVGLMSSEIFGYEQPETLRYAEALGIAMQLTNILRDVREDAMMKRIYLPAEDLRRFDVSEEQIFANEFDENFVRLMRFEIERARYYYSLAEQGIPLLKKDTRFTVLLAARIYGKILDKIEKLNYNVFASRAHTTSRQKILMIPRIWREARNFRQ